MIAVAVAPRRKGIATQRQMCNYYAQSKRNAGPRLLLELKVRNFRSIQDEQTFSMLPAKGAQHVHTTQNAYYPEVMKVAALYGPNGAGKSNLVNALQYLQDLVEDSGTLSSEGMIPYTPYMFDPEMRRQPTEMEVSFSVFGEIWRYGFSVRADRVVSEWLYRRNNKTSRENYIFVRKEDGVSLSKHVATYKDILQNKTNKNQLFLSKLNQFNEHVTRNAYMWIVVGLRVISSVSDFPKAIAAQKIIRNEDDKERRAILDVLAAMDIQFEDIIVNVTDIGDDYESFSNHYSDGAIIGSGPKGRTNLYDVRFLHRTTDGGLAPIRFQDESLGTSSLFGLAGMLVDSLRVGFTLVIDELNQNFHPEVLKFVVELFYSEESNGSNAQLIFTSHDTSLMSVLERDQVWLVEKDKLGRSSFFSLADFGPIRKGGIRRNEAFARNYLDNKYGALPSTKVVKAISSLSAFYQDRAWIHEE